MRSRFAPFLKRGILSKFHALWLRDSTKIDEMSPIGGPAWIDEKDVTGAVSKIVPTPDAFPTSSRKRPVAPTIA